MKSRHRQPPDRLGNHPTSDSHARNRRRTGGGKDSPKRINRLPRRHRQRTRLSPLQFLRTQRLGAGSLSLQLARRLVERRAKTSVGIGENNRSDTGRVGF
ncbi:MAG: hypothetical protein WKF71_09615 [Pyrinomonadaceae bacterium]